MITENTIYEIKNRSSSNVIYRIPDTNVRRDFAPGETKKIAFSELQALCNVPGGRTLLEEFLQIGDEVATKNLAVRKEVEYDMSEQDVVNLLTKGSLEAFMDALDFAPIGVIDLIKRFAVDLPLTDLNKMRALKEMTGFDAAVAIRHVEEEKMAEEAEKNTSEPVNRTRRVQPETMPEAPVRRAESKYKIVGQN